MFKKYAKAEILEVKASRSKQRVASLDKFADWSDHNYRTDDDYLYVRVRAISSRVNLNNDSWPSEELAKSYRTFIGKPLFVEHNNSDPRRTRGVIVDAKLHREDEKTASLDPYYSSDECWDCHKPPTWVELLLEVDAKTFPKFATAIIKGDIDGFSMGANVERSICSHCKNEATDPAGFCTHVASKGSYFDYTDEHGRKTSRKAVEHCVDLHFFELSGVVTPADETALVVPNTIRHASAQVAPAPKWFTDAVVKTATGRAASDLWGQYKAKHGENQVHPKRAAKRISTLVTAQNEPPQHTKDTAPKSVDTLRHERLCPVCGSQGMEDGHCDVCQFAEPPDGFDNPNLEEARETDLEIAQDGVAPAGPEAEDPMNPNPNPQAPPMAPRSSSRLNNEGRKKSASAGGRRGRIRVEEAPALPTARKASDKPKDAKVVSDHTKAVESSARKAKMKKRRPARKAATGATPNGGADVSADKRVDVEGVGAVMDNPLTGIDHQSVDKDVNVTGDRTKTWTKDNGAKPVTNDPFPAKGEGVKAAGAKQAGPAFPDHEPTKVDLDADIKEEVGDRTKTWSGTEGQADPVTQETGDIIDAHKAAARKHAFASMKLAETEIELGITSPDDKYNRVSELESTSQAEIDAQLSTLARVRIAGLRKQATKKAAATPLPSLQGRRMASANPSEHGPSDQGLSDSQAFM